VDENPRATEAEQEQVPARIDDEEEMRGPGGADPELPGRPEHRAEDDERDEDDE
jgi:hypothetical protein